jgi:hypothetical protein
MPIVHAIARLIRRFPATLGYMTAILIAMIITLTACSSANYPDTTPATGPDSDACTEALEALAEYDTDPSTPDNIEPTIEQMAEFNEAYEAAGEACES